MDGDEELEAILPDDYDKVLTDVVYDSAVKGCPVCRERRVTRLLRGLRTYICGYSRSRGTVTPCEGTRFLKYVIIPEPQEP